MTQQDSKVNNEQIKYRRVTWCWCCHTDLDNAYDEECPYCHWIICPTCGACSSDCDFTKLMRADPKLRISMREFIHDNPNTDIKVLVGIVNEQRAEMQRRAAEETVELARRLEEEAAELQRQQEERRQKELEACRLQLKDEIILGRKVSHPVHGVGEIIGIRYDFEKEKDKLYVCFGKKEKVFNYPETFMEGGMKLL